MRSDVFSLAMLIIDLLGVELEYPQKYDEKLDQTIYMNYYNDAIERFKNLKAELSAEFRNIILQMLTLEEKTNFPSMIEVMPVLEKEIDLMLQNLPEDEVIAKKRARGGPKRSTSKKAIDQSKEKNVSQKGMTRRQSERSMQKPTV